MRNIIFFIYFLVNLSITCAQKKSNLIVKIKASQTVVTLYTHVQLQSWLYNNGTKPISIFRQDFTASAWCGVLENWYCTFNQKKDTFPKLMERPSSGFNENNIIKLYPGDSMMVDTFGYTFYEPGSYIFTYNIEANRRKVKRYYALTALARKKIRYITQFNILTPPLNIVCKPVEFSSEKITDIPLDTIINNKKQINSLEEAFRNPEEVFILGIRGQLNQRDLNAISQLKNIHSLRLNNVNLLNKDSTADTMILNLPNLKELIVTDSQLEITDNSLLKFPKLENISFENTIYHNPAEGLNNLTMLKSITIANCQINSLTTDFSNLNNLLKLELDKNNLKEIPPINYSQLEYIDIQENELTEFPVVFNNPSLKSINVARNKITIIPEDIKRLKVLTDLDLSWNNISEIPPQIGKLKALTSLTLTGNQISKLPDKTKKLSNLQNLFLDSNRCDTIPSVIFKIKTLKQLVLRGNNITILPNHVGKLSQLDQLDIADNNISELPKSLLRLKNLHVLKVKGNPINENKTSRALRKKLNSGYIF